MTGETQQQTFESLTAEEAFQMGVAAHNASHFPVAEVLYRRAMLLDPRMAAPRHYLGLIMRGMGRSEEALEMLRGALAIDPSLAASRHALGMVHMNLGDYPKGWPLYEARLETPGYTPSLDVPMWRGERLAGKRIAIFPEQGLGDTIQMARFVPFLRDRHAEVTLLCRPPLESLFAFNFRGVTVRSAVSDVDLGNLDYWVMMLSIPERLRVTLDTVPGKPYLLAPHPEPMRAGPLRVGLVTNGNPKQENDARRSLSPEQAARLRAMPNVQTVSLHPEDSGATDFAQTANIVAGLDLVVSVDSSVGHLAGAMGMPTLLMVPGFLGDWRWTRGRNDSVWYPRHTLFRSEVNGDWGPALDAVEAAVARRVAQAGG